jgi:hypothetical protein
MMRAVLTQYRANHTVGKLDPHHITTRTEQQLLVYENHKGQKDIMYDRGTKEQKEMQHSTAGIRQWSPT